MSVLQTQQKHGEALFSNLFRNIEQWQSRRPDIKMALSRRGQEFTIKARPASVLCQSGNLRSLTDVQNRDLKEFIESSVVPLGLTPTTAWSDLGHRPNATNFVLTLA